MKLFFRDIFEVIYHKTWHNQFSTVEKENNQQNQHLIISHLNILKNNNWRTSPRLVENEYSHQQI